MDRENMMKIGAAVLLVLAAVIFIGTLWRGSARQQEMKMKIERAVPPGLEPPAGRIMMQQRAGEGNAPTPGVR